jgi:hypothetical protein
MQVSDDLTPKLDELFDERLENMLEYPAPKPGRWKKQLTDKRQAQAHKNMDKRMRSKLEEDSPGKFKNVILW